jgi:hypothetical protein
MPHIVNGHVPLRKFVPERNALPKCALTILISLPLIHACSDTSRQQNDDMDGLVVLEEPNDLGDVVGQRNMTHRIRIKNTTRGPIEITKFFRSCGCLELSPSSLRLESQEVRDVVASIALPGIYDIPSGSTSRTFTTIIRPIAKKAVGHMATTEIQITANVLSPLLLEPSFVELAQIETDESGQLKPPGRQLIHVRPLVDISELKVSCESDLGTASIRREDGDTFIEFTRNPKCLAQDKQQRIVLMATLRNGEQLSPIYIPVRNADKSPIVIEPANLLIAADNATAAECFMGVVHVNDSLNRDIDDVEVVSSSGSMELSPKQVNAKQWSIEVRVNSNECPLADEIGIRAKVHNTSCEATFTVMAQGS